MSDAGEPAGAGWYHAEGDPPGTVRYWDGEMWQGEPSLPPAAGGSASSLHVSYAEWGSRVGATLIDGLLVTAVFLGVVVLAFVLSVISEPLGAIVGILLGVVAFVGAIYVMLWLPGVTGQSPGRRAMGYKVVAEATGQPIGGWPFVGREIVGGLINNLCYIDYLWPLWDDKNQRLADKVVSSVAVQTPKTPMLPIFPDGQPF